MSNQPAQFTPVRRPDTEWALALAGSIEREVRECYDHQRKPGDEHAVNMTHQGLLDLANALRFAVSESAALTKTNQLSRNPKELPDDKWVVEVVKELRGREEALRVQGYWGAADHLKQLIATAPSAIARIDPMEFGRLKAELSAIERHLNRAGVARVSEKQATSDRVVGLIRNGVPSAPMMVGGFCTDRERCVADRDLLARAYEILWDGDGGPEGVDIANDIVATLKQPHAMILDRATKNATDRSTPK